MNKITYNNLFKYSLKVGFRAIAKGKITVESLKRILCPMDVSRYYELPVVGKNIKLKPKTKVLDISSPKLLTFYLANKFPKVKFYGVEKFKQELSSWMNIMSIPKNLILEYADATKLKYPSNYFDEVYSISVIEHLGDKNNRSDIKMMKEVYRVLKKGGRFYLTTIISNKGNIIYKNNKYYSKNAVKNKMSFFCRIYDYKDVVVKLLKPSKFKIIKEEICNYRYSFYEYIFNTFMPLSIILGWLNFFVAPVMIRVQNTNKKNHE